METGEGKQNNSFFFFRLFLFRQGHIQPNLLLIPYGAKDDLAFLILCLYLPCAGIPGILACPDKREKINR